MVGVGVSFLVILVLGLGFVGGLLYAVYALIRLAVRDGMRDADRTRRDSSSGR